MRALTMILPLAGPALKRRTIERFNDLNCGLHITPLLADSLLRTADDVMAVNQFCDDWEKWILASFFARIGCPVTAIPPTIPARLKSFFPTGTNQPSTTPRGPPMVDHKSTCAMHNGPALPPGPCDCGADCGATVPFSAKSTPLGDAIVYQGEYFIGDCGDDDAAPNRAIFVADALNTFNRLRKSRTLLRAAIQDAEQEIRLRKAKALARATLVPGDRVTVAICCGKRTTFTFSRWSDCGHLVRPRDGETFHPAAITRINGKRVRPFDQIEVTPEELAELCPAASDRYGLVFPPIKHTRVKGRANDLPF